MAVGRPAGVPLPVLVPTASPAPRTRVDKDVRGTGLDHWRQRVDIAAASAGQGLLREAALPERLRAIHRGIAQALARRGRAVEAPRHAAKAGDTALLGRIASRHPPNPALPDSASEEYCETAVPGHGARGVCPRFPGPQASPDLDRVAGRAERNLVGSQAECPIDEDRPGLDAPLIVRRRNERASDGTR